MFEIVQSRVESDIKRDFVALGFLIEGKGGPHSAFVIQYEDTLYEFHYTGSEIDFSQIWNDYYHKITYSVHPDEVPAFIACCQQIQKNAKPIYGYFYSGENYGIDGNHFGNKDLGERMTCVGFCLNVLKGFLEDDYLEYSDWDESTHADLEYLEKYCKKHTIDITKVKASHRRIAPIEFFTSGFFRNLPIRKVQIDGKIQEVSEVIEKKEQYKMN
jgi:hypothetical protein